MVVAISVAQQCAGIPPSDCSATEGCELFLSNQCFNQENCALEPPEKCKADKICIYHPEQAGQCQKKSFGCENRLSQKACTLRNKFCQWESNLQCIPIRPFPIPNCASLSGWECEKNSSFCELTGQCYDNADVCSSRTKAECLEANNLCHYTVMLKESCEDNVSFCPSLSPEACKRNKHCQFQQITKDQCVNEINCAAFTGDRCPTRICQQTSTPFICATSNQQCSSLSARQCKLDSKCKLSSSGICKPAIKCENVTDEASCEEYAKLGLCKYSPSSSTCSNRTDCSQFSTSPFGTVPNCEGHIGCLFIQGESICKPLKYGCAQLSPEQCRANKYCHHTNEQGYCSNNSFGCEKLSPEECLHNRRCLLNSQCTQLPYRDCKDLTPSQCEDSKYCRLKDQGNCHDRSFICPGIVAATNEQECIVNKLCQWTPAQKYSCENRYDCQILDQKQCDLNPSICTGISTETCQNA